MTMTKTKNILKFKSKKSFHARKSAPAKDFSYGGSTVPSMSVYKRRTEYPPGYSALQAPSGRFITPSDICFKDVMDKSYKGCVLQTAEKFKAEFHQEFQGALQGLDENNTYQFDVTQPAGLRTKLAKTFVTRCLVGDTGTTYKYLGLRMFSIPWDAGAVGSSPYSVKVGKLNEELRTRTSALLSEQGKEHVGSCAYNLTLINRYLCKIVTLNEVHIS